jgi:hypothetical protein
MPDRLSMRSRRRIYWSCNFRFLTAQSSLVHIVNKLSVNFFCKLYRIRFRLSMGRTRVDSCIFKQYCSKRVKGPGSAWLGFICLDASSQRFSFRSVAFFRNYKTELLILRSLSSYLIFRIDILINILFFSVSRFYYRITKTSLF